jgi:hypothetical protein
LPDLMPGCFDDFDFSTFVQRSQVHQRAIVIVVKGTTQAARIHAFEEMLTFLSVSVWTNWVEKKFYRTLLRALRRLIGLTCSNYCRW